MDNLCKQIGQPFKRLLTIVTKYMFTTDEFGRVLKEGPGQSVQRNVESRSSTSGAMASQDVQMSEPVQKIPTVVKPASEIPMTVDATLGVESEGVTIAGVKSASNIVHCATQGIVQEVGDLAVRFEAQAVE